MSERALAKRYPDGLGIRVPLIVVSPYSNPGYVSQRVARIRIDFALHGETFGLQSLGTRDNASDDLSDMLAFGNKPIRFKRIIHGGYTRNDTSPPDTDL